MMTKTLLIKQLKGFMHFYLFDRKTGKRKSTAKIIGLGFLILFCFLSLCICFVGISVLLGDVLLNSTDTVWMYFSMISIVSVILGGLVDSLASYSMLYLARDNETLLSMPIKPRIVVLSRMISVYIFALINLLYVMAPAYVVYWIKMGLSFNTIFYPIVLFFILGIIISIVTCIFGYVIAFLHKHIKSKIVTTMISTGFLLVFYYLIYFKFDDTLENIGSQAIEMGNSIKDNLFFSYHIGMANTGNLLSLIITLAISLALIILTWFILSRSFTKIALSSASEKKKNITKNDFKTSSINKALFNKELKHFTNSVAYMMNCGLGLVFLLVGGIVVLFKKNIVLDVYDMLKAIPGGYEGLFPIIIVVATLAVSSLAVVSAPSISLEGKNLWLLKSLPINPISIFRSKSNLHFYLNVIPSLFFMLCVLFVLNDNSVSMVLGILIVVFLIRAQGDLGVLLNLKRPNLEWDNETIPVKQSISVVFAMLIGWLEVLVILALSFILINILKVEYIMALIFVISFIFAFLIRKRLDKKGLKLFNEL